MLRFSKYERLHKSTFAHFFYKEQQPPGLDGWPENHDTECWVFPPVPLHILPFRFRDWISSLSRSHGCGGQVKALPMSPGCGAVTSNRISWVAPTSGKHSKPHDVGWGGVCDSLAEIRRERQDTLPDVKKYWAPVAVSLSVH